MAGSLEGPIAKLTRAESQGRVLKREVETLWPPGKAWPVRTEEDRGGLEYRFYLGELPEVKSAWVLIAGEIMFNLRSALDHLAWELHVRHYGRRTIPEEVEFASQFPIFDTYDKWRRKGLRRIKELGERERRAIRLLQPYQSRHDKWRLVRSDLSVLNAFHNIDKHRQLHPVVGAHHAALMEDYGPEFGFRQTPTWGRVKPHAQVETWTFAKTPPKIQPHHGAFMQISLDYGGNDWGLIPLLEGLTMSVALILRRFANRFPPIMPPITSAYTGHWWKSHNGRSGTYLL